MQSSAVRQMYRKLFFLFMLLTLGASCDFESVNRLVHPGKKSVVIGIQPFNGFDNTLIDTIASAIKRSLGVSVVILPAINLPPHAFVQIKTPRYRADTLIAYLKKIKPDTIDYIIGLTQRDISITKTDLLGRVRQPSSKYRDFGIFGLGYRPGPSCIVSLFRLGGSPSRPLVRERIKKIVIHELGHNMNLAHCSNDRLCVMNDAAETIKTIDRVKLWFCDECLPVIRSKSPRGDNTP